MDKIQAIMKVKLILLAVSVISMQWCTAQTNFTISKSETFSQKKSKPKMFFGIVATQKIRSLQKVILAVMEAVEVRAVVLVEQVNHRNNY